MSAAAEDPELWNNPERAQKLMQERTRIKEKIDALEGQEAALEDAEVLFELAQEEGDESVYDEVGQGLAKSERTILQLEMQRMLGGENDAGDAVVSINAGAGGTESQDWAEMLLRMVSRYCERKGFRVSLTDIQPGEEAGVKGVTLQVEGTYAYGYLKAESGVHRLVRISPFDSNARRHTSFASIFVFPLVDDSIEIEINDADLKIDTFRASGAGGQHVNRTDSAVRLTHLPTGIVVSCQGGTSARSTRIRRPRSRSCARVSTSSKFRSERRRWRQCIHAKRAIDFGSQIRSYVLHPYRLVKDHRTNLEIGNVDSVLDGDLDELITTFLLATAGGASE